MEFNFKFGLKLWSVNQNYINNAVDLYRDNIFQYIELYVVPGTYESCIKDWRKIIIPFIIHAPHWNHGLNLSDEKNKVHNIKLAEESFKYADSLNVDKIIFHPGINGHIEVTAEQLRQLNDKRILIENKPYFGLVDDLICVGYSPEEIKFLITETGVDFCFDIGHAVYSANAQGINQYDYIKKFLSLNPQLYHLSDGDFFSKYDSHKHIGKGNFPFNNIFPLIPENSMITVETEKDSDNSLDDFRRDVNILKSFIN